MKRLVILTSALLLLGLALPAQVTLHVPAGFPTIQAAIDAAVTGDTVLVAPGTYFENLSINGKTITLKGSGGAATTIVDGSMAGPVLSIGSGLDRLLLIEGLTFQNGLGADANVVSSSAAGGGIDIRDSTPTVLHCDVLNNVGGNASNGAIAGPGGILIRGTGPDAQGPAIRNCNIKNNTGGNAIMAPTGGAASGSGGAGGIMAVEGNAFIRASIIENNQGGDSEGQPNFRGSSAGGIGLVLPAGDAIIEDCEIHFNTGGAALSGAAFAGAGGIGSKGAPFIHYCNIGNNQGGDALAPNLPAVIAFPVAGAGGVDGEDAVVESTYLRDNTGGDSGNDAIRGGAGAIGLVGDGQVIGCVLGGNVGGADLGGLGAGGAGGIHNVGGDIVVLNSTISDNTGGAGSVTDASGGLFNSIGDSALVTNSILWNNLGGGQAANEIDGAGIATVTFSDVAGGFTGLGNIDMDPLFVSPASRDYHLGAGSPCIDAGVIGDPLIPALDIDGDLRVIGASIDMGADEANQGMVPGTLEGLDLGSLIDNEGDPSICAKLLRSGDLLEIRIHAPGACFNAADMFILASPLPTGTMPPTIPELPGFHLNPVDLILLAPGPLPIYDGPWGCGKRFFFQNGQSFPGWSLWVQGFALDANAANGFFAITEAHELRFD